MRGALRMLAVTALIVLIATLAACSTSRPDRGKFYQQDGPPTRTPADLAQVPDAVPKVESFHPYANRPYVALGRTYTPMTADVAFRQRGMASWYGRQYHGRRTSNGETYDMFSMTAAHPTLPLPSYVRVTSMKSGASVLVRVNDRGPFIEDRIIDLSYAAAVRLGVAAAGTGEVQIERLTNADIAAGGFRRSDPPPVAVAPVITTPVVTAPANAPTAAPPGAPTSSVVSVEAMDLPRPTQHWAIQLGAYTQSANAESMRSRVAADLNRAGMTQAVRVERVGNLYRVLVGEAAERALAMQTAQQLERSLNLPTMLLLY